MVIPLPALCVFKHRTLSLHPSCVCVRELFFDICWEKLLIYSSGGLPSHTYEVLEQCDFFNPSKTDSVTQLKALPVGPGSLESTQVDLIVA